MAGFINSLYTIQIKEKEIIYILHLKNFLCLIMRISLYFFIRLLQGIPMSDSVKKEE